ncbi:MAG: RHS repeat-associated core domain-containing protein [Lachnospiraceae bacterium]
MEENGQLVQFLYNEEKEVIAEETDGEVIRYIRRLGIISSDSESARTYYHYISDNQGSIRLILTDTANDRRIRNYYCYDAFGESVISHEDVHNRFRFNGEQYDPVTSQYYLTARFYNPVIGRFTQEDTYYGDGLNLYEYCRNNPVLYRDPSGHDAVNQGNLYGNESGNLKSQIQKLKLMTPQQLLANGWQDVTDPRMAINTLSKELYNPKTGMRIRFDKGVAGASGFEAVDHYHIYNKNYTNKKVDFYFDINGNTVGKGSKASHIVIGGGN